MDYNHINGFFDRVKNIIYQKQETKKIIQEVISKNISFNISEESFDYKNGVVVLRCSPVVKNEVMICKGKILKDLKDSLRENTKVIDIK